MELVCDIEADNLLRGITKFHCGGAIDVETGQEFWFRPHQFKEYKALLDSAKIIIFHNANGYDIPAMEKISTDLWKPKAHVRCTKVMSQVLNFTRFGFGHSLSKWGIFFEERNQKLLNEAIRTGKTVLIKKYKELKGSYYKGDYTGGFESFNEEMFDYMKQDVRLTVHVYKHLMNELKNHIVKHKNKSIYRAIYSETFMDYLMAQQSENGWLFNKEACSGILEKLDEKLTEISEFINPLLPSKAIVVDPDTSIEREKTTGKRYGITKTPTYTKSGSLGVHHVRWFGLNGGITINNSPFFNECEGFCRIDFVAGDIGNTDTVKDYLYTIGWQPDDWNWKRNEMGELVKVSPKLTDSSLESLGEVGKAIMEFYTLRSRQAIIEGWKEHIDTEGRLHGDVFNIGTPTFRQTHKIIANLPSGKATLGPEIRSLFISREGYKLVSADSAACQLRLLAFYMNDPEFLHEVLNGDIHQKNADIIGCTRDQAKRFIFAFLYGAGAAKLSGYIGQTVNETKKSIARYKAALPKLTALIEKVNRMVETQGFILGLDNRPIMLDKGQKHKSLNYLIQGAEAVVMKATVIMIDKKLKEANIDFKHLLFYHDEHTIEVREDQAELAREIISNCFEEAPKSLGVNIMTCGDCKIGNDYYEVH